MSNNVVPLLNENFIYLVMMSIFLRFIEILLITSTIFGFLHFAYGSENNEAAVNGKFPGIFEDKTRSEELRNLNEDGMHSNTIQQRVGNKSNDKKLKIIKAINCKSSSEDPQITKLMKHILGYTRRLCNETMGNTENNLDATSQRKSFSYSNKNIYNNFSPKLTMKNSGLVKRSKVKDPTESSNATVIVNKKTYTCRLSSKNWRITNHALRGPQCSEIISERTTKIKKPLLTESEILDTINHRTYFCKSSSEHPFLTKVMLYVLGYTRPTCLEYDDNKEKYSTSTVKTVSSTEPLKIKDDNTISSLGDPSIIKLLLEPLGRTGLPCVENGSIIEVSFNYPEKPILQKKGSNRNATCNVEHLNLQYRYCFKCAARNKTKCVDLNNTTKEAQDLELTTKTSLDVELSPTTLGEEQNTVEESKPAEQPLSGDSTTGEVESTIKESQTTEQLQRVDSTTNTALDVEVPATETLLTTTEEDKGSETTEQPYGVDSATETPLDVEWSPTLTLLTTTEEDKGSETTEQPQRLDSTINPSMEVELSTQPIPFDETTEKSNTSVITHEKKTRSDFTFSNYPYLEENEENSFVKPIMIGRFKARMVRPVGT